MSRNVTQESYCGCLYYAANALARKMTRLAEQEFAETGLAPSPAFIVMTVNAKPGIPAGEIAVIQQLTPSTVTRLIDRLVAEGFLRRRTEGRYVRVFPTARARRLDAALREAWRRLHVRYSRLLGEESGKALTSAIYDSANRLEER